MRIPIAQYWNLLVAYLRPQSPRVLMLALLLFSNIGLQLVNPQIMRLFIDTAQQGGATATLVQAALLFIGIALITQVIVVGTTYMGETVAWTATNHLRRDLAAHCLRLDLSFHKGRTPGELIERIDGDVTALANFFSQFVISLLGSLILMLGALILLFREDWRAGLGLTLFVLASLAFLTRMQRIGTPYWGAVREASATFFGFLGEQLAGTEDIRANGASGYVMRRFYELLRGWWRHQRKAGVAGYAMWMSNIVVLTTGQAVAFGLGAYLFMNGAITIGTVYMLVAYTLLLLGPMDQIRSQLQDLQQASASIGRVEQLWQTASKVQDGAGAALPDGALAVDFDGVSFGYDANNWVLRDVSFQVSPGRVLGLLGRTGSGKTTLARLLLRLYDPQQGEIRLSGTALPTATLDGLRRHVGLVTQDVQLFHATVRDNLAFFNRSIPDAQIIAVLEDLGLAAWYRALPLGLDTMLESDSSGLSAGEAQLVAFARVFLKDPGLVILDEASSRLDPLTERLIERAITKLLAGRTAILIAHHLATVQRADEILILEDGAILEHGDRARLAADSTSRFYRLLQTGLAEVLA